MTSSFPIRGASLVALALTWSLAGAQNTGGSPYSAYGFGDLQYTTTAASTAMGGAGIAISEPFCVIADNPASFASSRQPELGGTVRPVFEATVRGSWLDRRTSTGRLRRADGEFMGFNIGVPFGKGRWGMAFGLNPFSNVGYTLVDRSSASGVDVQYEYSGSGGLNKAYMGLGRTLYQQKADTSGNLGTRLALGASFEFLFGGLEQTRRTIYPVGQSYTNTSAYASLVLRAPTGTLGLQLSTQVVSRARVDAHIARRWARWQERLAQWRSEHPNEAHPRTDRPRREAAAWRATFGLSAGLPTVFSASSTDLVTLYYRNALGSELVIDTIPSTGTGNGTITLPPSIGVGVSVHDRRWLFTVEARRRDWAGLQVDLDGYALPAALRASTTFSAGARFTPRMDGGGLQRITYRAGARYVNDYLQVHGDPVTTIAASAGLSVPLNWAQTNSHFHLTVEALRRGDTGNGRIQENMLNLWFGVSITPWKLERWFRRFQIQ